MGRESELFKAAQAGNTAALEKAFAGHLKKMTGGQHGSGIGSIRSKLHPNIQDDSGSTLLHHAILNGHSGIVELLLKCGASTKISDNSGSPPLHLAAWKGDLESVKMLVTQGPSYANVNQQNDSDDTALHLASQYGYAPVVEFLLQRHADPLLRNERNETPLDLASQYGHLACVHFLISYSPESLRPTLKGFSPLHLAARNGHSLVALSLINAGISINTVCERGTALHEAAMCGKSETVDLLLDKGVNVGLKDAEGRTVMEVMEQFPAGPATQIRRKIQTHLDQRQHRTSSSLLGPKTRSCRVIAIARNTSQPLVEGSSALPFHTGDHIQVERSEGSGVYVGSVKGASGSFLAEDVLFYTEQDGELVATNEADLHMTSDLTNSTENDSTAPPDSKTSPPPGISLPSPILESEEPDEEKVGPSAKAFSPRTSELVGPLKHPHSDSVSSAASEDTPTSASTHPGSGIFEMSMSSGRKSAVSSSSQETTSEPTPEPTITNSDLSTPSTLVPSSAAVTPDPDKPPVSDPVSPVAVTSDPGSKKVATPEPEGGKKKGIRRDGSQRLSKKEKRFQLSKDDGKYAELNPINPLEAKKEFGEKLRLNPVGPAFGGVVSSEEVTSHTSSAVPGPEGGEEAGSYYVLEVGNFDAPPSPAELVEGVVRTGTNPNKTGMGPDTAGNGVAMPVAGEGGYFMINTGDPTLTPTGVKGQDAYSVVSMPVVRPPGKVPAVPPNNRSQYENAPILQPSGSTSGQRSPKLHPHLIMASESEIGRVGQVGPARVQSEGKVSSYENVCRPGERDVVPVPALLSEGVASQDRSQARLSAYENVELLASSHQPSPSHNPTPILVPPKKRSSQKRGDVYEAVSLGKKKGGANSTTSSQANGVGTGQLSPDNNSGLESSIVPSSVDNQFAGLVITASRQLEDSLNPQDHTPSLSPQHKAQEQGSEGSPGHRGRTETVWDNSRVEKEWSQIDSLLEGVTGTIGDHAPLSPSLLSPSFLSPSHNSVGDPEELIGWLSALNLDSCTGALQINGFDNLRFLGGGVLAMDDLDDIGITSIEEKYNLMAAVSLLAPPPSCGHASTVLEWLGLLDLLELEGKFLTYSLKKIATLWDIELTSVVGVELLGWRKRLLYGIAELRRAHPEWAGHGTTPKSSPAKKPSYGKGSPLRKKRSSPNASMSPPVGSSPLKTSFLKDYRAMRSSSNHSSSSSISDSDHAHLSMRTPVEAQACVVTEGRSQRTPKLPSHTWKHENSALINDCINYNIKYLGSVLIKTLHGNQSAEEACLKLRTSTENMQKIPAITLSISWKGVKFVDAQSKAVVSIHAIRDVSCCAPDIEDKRVFAYITKDRTTGKNYSHVFMASSQEMADEIRMTLGQAFEICYQKVMQARKSLSSN